MLKTVSHTAPRDDLKDWPSALRLSAGKDALAVAFYETRCTAFGLPQWPWDKITEIERDTWRAEALVWLLAHAPVPRPRVDYVPSARLSVATALSSPPAPEARATTDRLGPSDPNSAEIGSPSRLVDFQSQIARFGLEMAATQVDDEEHCIYCGRVCPDTVNLPYCGPICAHDAYLEGR